MDENCDFTFGKWRCSMEKLGKMVIFHGKMAISHGIFYDFRVTLIFECYFHGGTWDEKTEAYWCATCSTHLW